MQLKADSYAQYRRFIKRVRAEQRAFCLITQQETEFFEIATNGDWDEELGLDEESEQGPLPLLPVWSSEAIAKEFIVQNGIEGFKLFPMSFGGFVKLLGDLEADGAVVTTELSPSGGFGIQKWPREVLHDLQSDEDPVAPPLPLP